MSLQFLLIDLWVKVYVAVISTGIAPHNAEQAADCAVREMKRRWAEGVFGG